MSGTEKNVAEFKARTQCMVCLALCYGYTYDEAQTTLSVHLKHEHSLVREGGTAVI